MRELRNAVERLLIMVESPTIEVRDVDALAGESMPHAVPHAGAPAGATPSHAADGVGAPAGGSSSEGGASGGPAGAGEAPPDPGAYRTLQDYKDEAEKVFILRKLRENRWNISRTARAIDTPRSNLYKKLEQYGISRDQVQE